MDDASLLQEAPHRRFNPLTREWVLVSPHRTKRPWLGKVEKRGDADLPAYDPSCYLCPGNERADGARNPKYSSTFAFDNDFAALLPDGPSFELDEGGLLVARAERGICRVICFSPRHDLTIPRMTPKEIGEVIAVWAAEFRRLGEIDWLRHVQIFENRGALMGASNPHPHCQIWANASVPVLPEKELAAFREYRQAKKSCLLCDYLQLELRRGERVDRSKMPLAQQQRFERPHCPERNDHRKAVILTNHPLCTVQLKVQIVAQQARFLRFPIFTKGCQLFFR